jgi:hypothetical protein
MAARSEKWELTESSKSSYNIMGVIYHFNQTLDVGSIDKYLIEPFAYALFFTGGSCSPSARLVRLIKSRQT